MGKLVLSEENLKIEEVFGNIVSEIDKIWWETKDYESVMVERNIKDNLYMVVGIDDYSCANCQNKYCNLKDDEEESNECEFANSYFLNSKLALKYDINIIKKNGINTGLIEDLYSYSSKNFICNDNETDYDVLFELLTDIKGKIDDGDYE